MKRDRIVYKRAFDPETGERIEVKLFYLDFEEVTEAEFKRRYPDKLEEVKTGTPRKPGTEAMISTDWVRPVRSDALAVHPRQRKAAMDHADRHGVPTVYDEQGRPVLRSQQHKKALAKSLGFHDNNSFNW